jgi:predicted transcriptional regulator
MCRHFPCLELFVKKIVDAHKNKLLCFSHSNKRGHNVTNREKAQAKIIKWKKQLLNQQDIAARVDIDAGIISKLATGKGRVSEAAIQKVLGAK